MVANPRIRGEHRPRTAAGRVQRNVGAERLYGVNAVDERALTLEPVREQNVMFDERFAGLRPHLVAVCRSLVGDDAEDVVQDTYLRARARLHQLRKPASLEAWLTAVAVRECYGRRRRRQRLADLLGAIRAAQPPESDPDLRALVEALPFRDRTVVVLHYGHGLSLEEIAGLLGSKPATIRSVLFRARGRLRAQLEP